MSNASPVVIRTSDRGYFKRCRQEWDFTSKIRQNWEPIQRYLAFDFGTAIHAGLQAYYFPTTWSNKSLREFNARHAFRETFKDLRAKIKVGDIELEERFDDSVELGAQMLEYYFLWAPANDNFTPIMVEIEFEVDVPGLEGLAVYQGRIDLVIETPYGYYIVDHKTAKQFGETSWLWLDDQCASYAWALRKMLGLEIRGVIYNQLRKSPPHRPRQLKYGGFSRAKNQDTTFELYRHTLVEAGINPRAYRDILLYLKQNPKEYIRRTKVQYSPRALEMVEKRITMEAREMMNPNVQIYPTPSPMNCNSCRFFGPCLQLQDGGEPSMENYERRAS